MHLLFPKMFFNNPKIKKQFYAATVVAAVVVVVDRFLKRKHGSGTGLGFGSAIATAFMNYKLNTKLLTNQNLLVIYGNYYLNDANKNNEEHKKTAFEHF